MSEEHELGKDFRKAHGSIHRSWFRVSHLIFSRMTKWNTTHLELDGYHFFLKCCRTDKGIWHMWVEFLGLPEEAENYNTTIKIKQNDNSEEQIYKGQVNPINSEERPKLSICKGLVFSDSVACQFTNDRRIFYEVEIIRNLPKRTPIVMDGSKHSTFEPFPLRERANSL